VEIQPEGGPGEEENDDGEKSVGKFEGRFGEKGSGVQRWLHSREWSEHFGLYLREGI
jgi:hypothetical protein